MNILLLIPATWLIGFLTAIPVGGTQIEIAKRSLRGHVFQACMVAAGSASSDIMYGLVAMFGLALFLQDKRIMSAFWLLNLVVLLSLGIFTLLRHTKRIDLRQPETVLTDSRLSLLLGFSIAATNAPIMLWWLLYAEIIKKLGIVSAFSTKTAVIFVFSGGLGIASYLTLLSFMLHRAGKFISNETETTINISLGVVLILLSFYSLHKLLGILF